MCELGEFTLRQIVPFPEMLDLLQIVDDHVVTTLCNVLQELLVLVFILFGIIV